MIPRHLREYGKIINHFQNRAFSRDDLFFEFKMKNRRGASMRIKSLLKYGIIYQSTDGLYRVSDDSKQILKKAGHNPNVAIETAEASLLSLVKRFDALLAGVRA